MFTNSFITYIKDISIIVGGLVALMTFVNGILEYSRQGRQKRVDQFMILRRRLKENEQFKFICLLLDTDDAQLLNVSSQDKRDLLGLFEEVALMMNSRLISKDIAHYMFGSYAIQCERSKYFWNNVDHDNLYWSLFRDFVDQMIAYEETFNYSQHKKRLRF